MMNWVNNLIELYDKNQYEVGKIIEKESSIKGKSSYYTLLPIAHTTAVAQIEVVIDGEGEFLRARTLEKSDGFTIIPCTINSASRAGCAVYPHPLCDNLKYIAGDYSLYGSNQEKNFEDNFTAYIKALSCWCTSKYSHQKAKAIFEYLKKRSLIHDLIECKLIQVDGNGIPTEDKISGINQMDSFVRFCVESQERVDIEERMNDNEGRYKPQVWLDHTLFQSFIQYYHSINQEIGLCYLTGKHTFLADLHPKKIRNEGDGTKLISGNDSTYYTFRGRFDKKNEAMGVGFEESQKAHNALKWIIRKQGYSRDGICIVTWASDMLSTVNVYDNANQVLEKSRFIIDESIKDSNDVEMFDDEVENLNLNEDEEDDIYNTKELNAISLANAIRGYRLKIKDSSNMVIMSFDAATPGRLAMTYYKELEHSKYLESIEYWQRTCSWLHTSKFGGNVITYEGMPSLREIAYAVYGIDQEGQMVLHSNGDGKMPMLISTFQRLIPCILEKRPIPKDIVHAAVTRASTPLAYQKTNWNKVLSVACSLVKRERFDRNIDEEEWSMDSDMSKICDRSFLYGRLLAIADRIEYTAYEKEELNIDGKKSDKNDKRVTNAKRYMTHFSQRPFSTWKNIEERIEPYLERNIYKDYYSLLINEVMDKFEVSEFADDSKLDGLYLLGFHKQSNEFFKKRHTESDLSNVILKED